jgi:hypothetical protein
VKEMRIPKMLSIVLAVTALAFAALGTVALARQVRAYMSWPKVNAVVEEINVHAIGDNAYGNISVRLSYSNSNSERSVWINRSFLPGRGARFAGEYAVGTHHIIWVDPATFEDAEVGLGWNLETLLVPVLLWSVCLCLLLAAKYFWRSPRFRLSRIPSL